MLRDRRDGGRGVRWRPIARPAPPGGADRLSPAGGVPGSDAGSNLRAAVLLAGALPPGTAPLVAFGGRVFDPTAITKISPQAVQPFGPDAALRGTVEAGLVTLLGVPAYDDLYAELDPPDLQARVAIITETFGPVAGFPDPATLDGLVLAGMGEGGFSAETAEQLRRAARRIPVVLSTRCPQGFRVNPAIAKHAFARARELGLVTAGYEGLNASKARIRLIAELGRAWRAPSGTRAAVRRSGYPT